MKMLLLECEDVATDILEVSPYIGKRKGQPETQRQLVLGIDSRNGATTIYLSEDKAMRLMHFIAEWMLCQGG